METETLFTSSLQMRMQLELVNELTSVKHIAQVICCYYDPKINKEFHYLTFSAVGGNIRQ